MTTDKDIDQDLAGSVGEYAQQQQAQPDTMESAVADYAGGVKNDTAGAIRNSAQQAVGVNPDKQAEINDTAKMLGMPPSAAAANTDVVKQRAAAQAIPAREITENTPVLAQHLSDPEKMKISSDDIVQLDQVEKSLQAQHGAGADMMLGVWGEAQRILGHGLDWANDIGVAMGGDPNLTPEAVTKSGIHDAYQAQTTPGQIAAAAPYAVMGPLGGIVMGMTQFMEKQQQLQESGVDQNTSSADAAVTGAVTAGSASIAPEMKVIQKYLPGAMGKILDKIFPAMGVGATQYGVTQGASQGILASQGYSEQAKAEAPTAAGAGQNALAMALFSVLHAGAGKVLQKFAGQTAEAQKSLLEADQARSLSEAAAASKLRARAPDTFQQFVSEASKDGPTENIYLNPDTFKQAGINPEELVQLSPSAREQLAAASASGSDIKIPTSEFATYLAGSKVGDAMLDHIKFDPEAFTKAEADEFFKTRDAQLQEDITRQFQKGENIATWQKSHDAVYQQIMNKLEASGKYPFKLEREVNARASATRYMVLGAREGMTPEEAYAKYGSTLNEPSITGETFNQISEPPIDANGNVVLHHFSRTAGLIKSDPEMWGQAGGFLTREERNRIGGPASEAAPGRTYAYIAPGVKGGGIRESGAGEHHYESSIPATKLYNAASDPLGLRDTVDSKLPRSLQRSAYERAIKENGFDGYWGYGDTSGMSAAIFKPLDLKATPYTHPEAPTFKQEDRPLLDAGFFSKMEDTLDKKLNATGTAKQYLDQIRSFASKGTFKPDELKYSGLEEALSDSHGIGGIQKDYDNLLQNLDVLENGLRDFKRMHSSMPDDPDVVAGVKRRETFIEQTKADITAVKHSLDARKAEPVVKLNKRDVMDMLQDVRERYALHEAVLEQGGKEEGDYPEIEFDEDHDQGTIERSSWKSGDVEIREEPGVDELKGTPGAHSLTVGNKTEVHNDILSALQRAQTLRPDLFPKTMFDLPPSTEGFDHAKHEVEQHDWSYRMDGAEVKFRAVEREPGGRVDLHYLMYDGADIEHEVFEDMTDAKDVVERMAEQEREYRQQGFNEMWDENEGRQVAGETQFMQYKMPGEIEDYKELVLHFPEINISGVSQHYRDFNTMAHIRFDTRQYEGKPVLFIEEIQADLHQQARNARAKKIESMMRNGNVSRENAEAAIPQDYGYANAHNADNGPITDVPFKKSYNELAMKRMLMWAVERGQNRIAWTTGKQQVDRWSGALRQHVDRIRWEKTAEGIHIIGEQKRGNNPFENGDPQYAERANTHYAETQLSDAIGKAMARKIIEDPNQTGIIEGDNIAVDDTGMSGVYDKVLPNVAKKVAGIEPEKIKMDFGNKTEEVHSIEITPEMKAKIKAEGMPLYQGSRGEYDPASRNINIFNAKNFSTYWHEDSHHFLNIYMQVALKPDAALDIKADMDTVLRWFKVAGDSPEARLDAWHNMPLDEQRPMHERWALANELYALKGESPSIELAPVMQRFRAWMLQLYKSAQDFMKLHPEVGEISPEIRAVMDRMHATTDQITEAQDARFLAPMFSTPAEAGMTPDEFKAYHLEDVQGTQDAITALNARSMRDLALTRNLHSRALRNVQAQALRWRKEVKAEVTEEVNNYPVNRVRTFLKTGMVDGEPITEGAHRLDIDALKDMYGDGPDAPWRDLESKYGASGIMGKDGLHPDIAAEMFGFGSGDDLVTALLNSENPKTQIDALTDQRMLQEHGDITNPQAMQEAADRAVHNEARTRSVATEMSALERMAGLKRTMKEAIKQRAEATVSTMAIRDIKPSRFMSQETRAAKASMKALKAGDVQEAARQKRNQTIQNYATRSANKGLDDVEKALRYFKKFDRKSARKAVGLDAIGQIDNLLGQFDLSKHTTLKELDLRAWINHQESLGLRPDVDPRLLKASGLTSYKDMSLEAFRGLHDAVKSIEAIGRRETSIADGDKRRAFKEVVQEAKNTLDNLPKISQPGERNPGAGGKGLDRINAKWLKLKEYVRSADASLLKMEQIGDWLDDKNSNGVFNRMLYRPLAKAVARQNEMKVEVGQLFKDLHDVVNDQFYKDFHNRYAIPELIDSRTGKPSQMLKSEILAMALNVRNDGNFNKMLKGEKWTKENVMAVLARHLTKTDIDFVNKYGDIAEYRYDDEVALNKRLGLESGPKVTGEDVELPNGTIKGGYYPLVYDSARDPNVQDRAAKTADAMFEENTYSRPNTDTGRMNARVEGYAAPILLSLDALPRVTMDKIRNLALRETIIDADKFIRNKDVRKGINEALGPEYYAQFRPWLQSIANDRAFDPQAASFIERAAHAGRISATMVGLGYRLSTILKHGTTAAAHSVGELGGEWAASGARSTFGSLEKMEGAKDFSFERSPFMAQRMANVERDFRDGLRDMDTKALSPVAGKVIPIYDDVRRFAMYGVAMSDMASCLPTWHGGYNKALAEGMSEEDAIYAADKAVRNAHGASGPQDIAQVMRGTELQKTLTMFYNFWNHFYNRQRDIGRGFTQARSTGDFANLLAKSFFYIGATAAVHAYYSGPKQKDDDRKLFTRVGEEIAATMFDGIPIARDIANVMAEKGLGGLKDLNLEQSAAAPLTGTAKSVNDIKLALEGKPDPKWVRNAFNTAGYIFGLPTGQVAQTAQFLWDVNKGVQRPNTGADWFNGLVHGRK